MSSWSKRIYLWSIFLLTLFALIVNIVFDFTIVNKYNELIGEEVYTPLHWLSFFTHWTMMLVCGWSAYELFNIYVFKKISKNTYLKQLTFSTVILLGIVAFPTIYGLAMINDFRVIFGAKSLSGWNSDELNFSQITFVEIGALINTIYHLIIPILCFFYFVKNGRLSKEMDDKEIKRNMSFNFLYIVVYFVWVLILTIFLNVQNPYSFENFGNYEHWYLNVEAIIINIIIGALFIMVNHILIKYNNKFYKDGMY